MRKKFSVFQDNITHIKQMISKGYTYNDIISDLKDNHSLDLSFNTFNSYLYRYRKENPNDEIGESKKTDNDSIKSKSGDKNESKPAEITQVVNDADNVKPADKKQHFNTRKDGDNFISNLIE
ncbi:TPA: hypothetical protein ACXI2C_003535 [Acinetobacter baumannii]|nr:hypothetical protein DKE50_021765 [Acinetobacter nosocomialis]